MSDWHDAWHRAWPDCGNVRDIGGLPLTTGGRTRSAALIRADSLDRLTPEGVTAVHAHRVRRIVDLRSDWELPESPHPFLGDTNYLRIPFIDSSRDHERDPARERTRADLYKGSIDRNARQVAAAVSAIATAPDGTVVAHCVSGVDRTGMLVAIMLDAIGVDRMAIEDDYVASQPSNRATLSPAENRTSDRRMPPVETGTMLELLDHIDQMHNGTGAYLRRHGFADDQLALLRRRLADGVAG